MTAIPPGIRPESARKETGIPSGKTPDSALSQPASQPATESGLGLGTSLRASNGLQATTITLLILRPDWPEADTAAVLARDPRPWRTVVAAALACALDPAIEHPSRIETTNTPAIAAAGPTPVPPSLAELRRTQRRLEDDDCGHGDIRERCALCRHHRSAEEPA